MYAIDALLSIIQLIVIGVPVWLALRPRNWGSYPLWVSTLERFSSFDPWRGQILSDWNLELFLIAHVKSALPGMRIRVDNDRWLHQPPGPGKRRLKMVEALALRRGPDDAPHFLPRLMAKLWLDGICPTERLAWLLCDMEPALKNYDFSFRRRNDEVGGLFERDLRNHFRRALRDIYLRCPSEIACPSRC